MSAAHSTGCANHLTTYILEFKLLYESSFKQCFDNDVLNIPAICINCLIDIRSKSFLSTEYVLCMHMILWIYGAGSFFIYPRECNCLDVATVLPLDQPFWQSTVEYPPQ